MHAVGRCAGMPITLGSRHLLQHCANSGRRQLATKSSAPAKKVLEVLTQLGNYLGALQSWVSLQNHAETHDELYFFLAGMHALTMPQSPAKLREDRRCAMASLIAAGIDPNRCTLFHQDEVPGHTELMWILSCIAPFGRLERMTTWKSKLVTAEGKEAAHESHLQLGLFTYPVLQAADILLYHATHVPVGEDQTQHLELTRDFAHLFNQKYNTSYFVRPVCLLTPTKRILSLRDPSQKMSKSAPDANSRILLTDSPNVIQKKIRRAVTDSERCITYEPDRRPAISNLVAILAALNGATTGNGSASSSDLSDPGVMAQHLEQITGGSGSKLKEVLAESIIEALRPFQTEYTKLVDDPAYLEQIAALGRAKASQRAAQTLEEVRKIIGIAP